MSELACALAAASTNEVVTYATLGIGTIYIQHYMATTIYKIIYLQFKDAGNANGTAECIQANVHYCLVVRVP